MSRDLRGALHDWAEQEQQRIDVLTPDTTTIATGLTRRVVRRRAVRAGTSVAAAAVLVGGVALGVHALDREAPVLPADPTPSPTSTPEPSPTVPAPTPTGTPLPPSSATDDALPLPDGVFETTDASWSLVQLTAAAPEDADAGWPGLYLLAPDGMIYSVPVADSAQASGGLHDWLPGTSLAIAFSRDAPFSPAVVDLLTGEASEPMPADTMSARFARDGSTDVWASLASRPDELARLDRDAHQLAVVTTDDLAPAGQFWLLSPKRSLLVVNSASHPRAVDLTTMLDVPFPLPYPQRPDACIAWGWVDDGVVLLVCSPGGMSTVTTRSSDELWLVPVGSPGQTARALTGVPTSAQLGGMWRVGDRIITGTFNRPETQEWWEPYTQDWWEVTTSGALVHLSSTTTALSDVVAGHGGELVITESTLTPAGTGETSRVLALDPFSGATRTVLEGPAAANGNALSTSPQDVGVWNPLLAFGYGE